MADLLDEQRDRYITVEMVAYMLTCTPEHVRNMVKEGVLAGTKLGSRAIRISERSVLGFIEKNKINPEDLYDPDIEEKKAPVATKQTAKSRWMARTPKY